MFSPLAAAVNLEWVKMSDEAKAGLAIGTFALLFIVLVAFVALVSKKMDYAHELAMKSCAEMK